MHTVTSFHGSNVPPEQLKALMTDYVALEHAKELRRLLVTRCGLAIVAVLAVGPGLRWLPAVASLLIGAGFLGAIGFAWLVEVRLDRLLASRLKEVPGAAEHVVQPGAS
jgi:hypothetical protein